MKKTNIFFDVFCGEMVEIITDLDVIQTVKVSEDNEAIPGPAIPMVVNGFLMDIDEKWLYLSQNGEQVNEALPIDAIKHIAIIDVQKELNQAFDNLPDPEGNEFH